MFKKRAALLALVCALLLSMSCATADQAFRIGGLGYLSLPDSFMAVTPESPADAPFYTTLGVDHSIMIATMDSLNAKLVAAEADLSREFVVIVDANPIGDLHSYSDSVIMLTSWEESFAQKGLVLTKMDIYRTDEYTWLRFWLYNEADPSTAAIECCTTLGDSFIDLTLTCYDGSVDAGDEALMMEIIGTISFE